MPTQLEQDCDGKVGSSKITPSNYSLQKILLTPLKELLMRRTTKSKVVAETFKENEII